MLELRRPIVAVASCMRDGQDKLATTIVDDAPGCDAVGHAIGSNSPQRQAADLDEVEPSKLLRGDRHTFSRGLTHELSRAAKRRRLERSEERRVGKECVSPGRSRWAPEH